MIDQLRLIKFLFTEDPVFRCKDHISLAKRFHVLWIAPVEFFHFFPVHILITIRTGFDMAEFTGGNRVTNPEYKLAVFVVGDLGMIHPKTTDRYGTVTGAECICRILITWTHVERTLGYVYHARRLWQHIS